MQTQRIAAALGGAPPAPRRLAAAAAARRPVPLARRAVVVASVAGEVPVTFQVEKKVSLVSYSCRWEARQGRRACRLLPRCMPPRPGLDAAARPFTEDAYTLALLITSPGPFTPRPPQVKPGEHVRVVGQPRVLGEWDIGRAPRLELVQPDGDLWSGTVDGLVVGAPFPFKCACSGGGGWYLYCCWWRRHVA